VREWEAELALPLWLPGERERQGAIVNAERDQYDTALTAAKLKIAGEVRDAYWQARLAEKRTRAGAAQGAGSGDARD